MNWLAHIFLSENHIDYQLGNLMADRLKGRAFPSATDAFKQGLAMHKQIDLFTDSHAVVKQSKARLQGYRYLNSVIIDVVYDYLLTQHWERYADPSLTSFVSRFHHSILLQLHHYPESEQAFMLDVLEYKILLEYRSLAGIERTFKRIDRRLSPQLRRAESLARCMPAVLAVLDQIEVDFLVFFPELIQHFQSQAPNLDAEHWIKTH